VPSPSVSLIGVLRAMSSVLCTLRAIFFSCLAARSQGCLRNPQGSCVLPHDIGDDTPLLQVRRTTLSGAKVDEAGPSWGCGLVGSLPNINADGTASAETQRLIDGIKSSSSFNKATYWNWNLAPQEDGGVPEYLTEDFIFMPEIWGVGPVVEHGTDGLRDAGKANFQDMMGGTSPATMATILLGMNEPDIVGSCMGNMMGKCTAPCSDEAVNSNDCPAAQLNGPPAEPNEWGECNCWQFSHATGVGYWPLDGCAAPQPLPSLWDMSQLSSNCVNIVMDAWKQTALVAHRKGYQYLSTPQVAVSISYARKFIQTACGCDSSGQCACTDASCGCPVYVVFHFYGNDCQPKTNGDYETLTQRLGEVAEIMEAYPFVLGAIINEVGMLNCPGGAICTPDSGLHPANQQPDHGCPSTEELPNGLATFIEEVLDISMSARTADGRPVLKGFSWFNEDEAGGTYNLKLQDKDGRVNELGQAYMTACTKWAQQSS